MEDREIIVGQTYVLTQENGSKTKVWGRKGDKVKIISISGNAVIYEDKSGERFPCNKNILK